jgi:L-fuconate dehydratase
MNPVPQPNRIVSLKTFDVRFPTSDHLDGSDATNKDPDYSAAYVVLETERRDRGYGLIFTIGRGNDLCCRAVEAMQHLVVGQDFDSIRSDVQRFYEHLKSDSQLRWLGPEKGVIHMAAGGIMNAIWDMWARCEDKPLWRLIAGMSAEQLVDCLDLRYVTDVLTRAEALEILRSRQKGKEERIRHLERDGFPAYTTSPGWLGYSDDKLSRLCKEAVANGFRHIKLKVGENLEDDIRRCGLVRDIVGDDIRLMIDANQIWEVEEAIDWVSRLAPFKPWFIEEPTSPDDVLGHRKIRESLNGIQIATGEHCQNRILFKQFIAHDAIDIVQIDACRLSSLNEILTVCLIAAKYGKPVCPHAGGVGLCEYVQHLSMIDYVCIAGDMTNRVAEYVEQLHEHFEDPCRIHAGAYVAPSAPGYSAKLLDMTLKRFVYPTGAEWLQRARKLA